MDIKPKVPSFCPRLPNDFHEVPKFLQEVPKFSQEIPNVFPNLLNIFWLIRFPKRGKRNNILSFINLPVSANNITGGGQNYRGTGFSNGTSGISAANATIFSWLERNSLQAIISLSFIEEEGVLDRGERGIPQVASPRFGG